MPLDAEESASELRQHLLRLRSGDGRALAKESWLASMNPLFKGLYDPFIWIFSDFELNCIEK